MEYKYMDIAKNRKNHVFFLQFFQDGGKSTADCRFFKANSFSVSKNTLGKCVFVSFFYW